MLQDIPPLHRNLLIGFEDNDDAAVIKLRDDLALVQSLDFFMPIVDNPFHFGQIAACNSLSDIYAMGADPIMALAILGFPIKKLPASVANEIMKGGADICAQAGIPLSGGHSIDDTEPKFGLSVSGVIHPDQIWSNSKAQADDVLILTKPLGIGIMGSSIKKGELSKEGYDLFIKSTTMLNAGAAQAGKNFPIHAATDITGFGLIGHLLEMAKGSQCSITINYKQVPIHTEAIELLRKGIRPGATARNLSFVQDHITYHESITHHDLQLLADPQTSGGLLFSVSRDVAPQLCSALQAQGCLSANMIGSVQKGSPSIYINE
ncbi:MAG: selenide, water dikinase SelD [Deltaproteobacteria bacterium]|nr:selenide, water dikinase SelD [Deltaproteobacteria bacterium]